MDSPVKTNEYFNIIGRVVVKFSELEMCFKSQIGFMVSDDHGVNIIVTAGAGLMELATLFRALFLFRVSDEHLQNQCHSIWNKAKTINEKRNKYLHSEWFFYEDEQMFLGRRTKADIRKKEGFVLQFEDNKIEPVKELLSEMTETGNELSRLMNQSRGLIEIHFKRPEKNIVRFNKNGNIVPHQTNLDFDKETGEEPKSPTDTND